MLLTGMSLVLFPLQPPPGLPNRSYVRLTKADAKIIEHWISNKLGSKAVRGQKDNITTNRSEASHLTVLRGSPKCRNRLRNFTGRARSAVHSMTMGVIDSVVSANSILGAENAQRSPASRTRRSLRERDLYHKKRKKSVAYKTARYAASRRARHERQSKYRGYQTGVQDPVVRLDHPYT